MILLRFLCSRDILGLLDFNYLKKYYIQCVCVFQLFFLMKLYIRIYIYKVFFHFVSIISINN